MAEWHGFNGILMVVSIIVLLYLGFRSARHIQGQSDNDAGFLVAGRTLGPLVAAATVMATGYSGWGFVGSPGVAYQYGSIEILGNFFFGPAIVLAVLLFGRHLSKRAQAMGSYTIPEFIARGHGEGGWSRTIHGVAATITIVLLTVFLTSQITAVALLAGEWLGISKEAAAILMVMVIVLYTLLGGLLAVAWTDTLMLAGMVFAALVVTVQISGDMGIATLVSELDNISSDLTNPDHAGPYGDAPWQVFLVLPYAFLWAAVLPYMSVRFLAFRPDIKFHKVALYAAPMGVLLSLIPIVGLYVRATVGDLANADEAMPVYLREFIHPALAGIITLCILFAMKSTANSVLHTISSAVSHDLRLALFPDAEEATQRSLTINRSMVAILGLLGLVLALYAPPFFLSWLGIVGTGTLMAALVGPVMVASFWRGNAMGALAAMIGGSATSGGLLLFSDVGWMSGPLLGCLVSAVAYALVSQLTFGLQPRATPVQAGK